MSSEPSSSKIAVVGTGVIGASWVAYFLAKGFDVAATDPAPIAAEDQARLIAAILAQSAAHLGTTYPLHGPIELDQAGIGAAVSEVLGRRISYRPLTIPQYRERLEKAGLPEFMIQHFCAIAADYQNDVFSGDDKIIAGITGQRPMTVQEFVGLHRDAFEAASAAA
jgi:NAD(P)H dehydrogenase (quinone)